MGMVVGFDVIGFLISWASLFGIYAILAISLNLETGYAGMANFGKVAFYGIGAYLTATITLTTFLLVNNLWYPLYDTRTIVAMDKLGKSNPLLSVGLFIANLVIAFLVAGAVGYLITYPTLRVGPAFTGITVLSFGELLRIVLRHLKPLGATKGLAGIPHPLAWLPDPRVRDALFAVLTLTILIGIYLVSERIGNSPFGRVLRAIRDDEVATLCLGKHVPRIKALTFFIGSGFAGVAGALWAYYVSSVNPDMFVPVVTFNVWAMVIFGGLGSNLGALVGAAVLTFVDRVSFVINLLFPNLPITPDYIRWMVVGLIIVLTLLFRPKGLIPEKPIKTPAWSVVKGGGDDG